MQKCVAVSDIPDYLPNYLQDVFEAGVSRYLRASSTTDKNIINWIFEVFNS